MSLTPEQRAEISRQNGKKSQGPVTPEGKEKSRRNAVKHGLRAEVLALPTEGPEAVAARADAWNDYYKPHSPAAQHLVTQCVQATLLADRVHRAHAAALTKQVREAQENWDRAGDDHVAALVRLSRTDPAEALRLLKRSSQGCLHMLARWEHLDGQLAKIGRWTGPERDEAIRLMGFDPDPETLQGCPEAWLTRLYNLMCLKNPSDKSVRWLIDRLPEAYRATYSAEVLPEPSSALACLRAMIVEEVARLDEESDRLSLERDDPDRAEAPDRAMVLQDAPSARLFLRYHAEARLSFHRAYTELVKALERDKAEPAAAAAVTPNEPGTAAVSGAEAAVAPTEPEASQPDAAADPGGDAVPLYVPDPRWPSPFEPGPPVSEADVQALAAVLHRKGMPVGPVVTPVS